MLKQNFNREDLVTFENNVKTLSIIKKKNPFSFLCKSEAHYNLYGNKIVLNKKIDFHELFHAASSYYSENNMYTGFQNKNFGIGLNEGYTQLLARRYFSDNSEFYLFEMLVSYYLERIIGKKKMQSYYLNGNLPNLIKDLTLYSNEISISHFISRLDYYCKYAGDTLTSREDKFLFNQSDKIIKFLIECYEKKIDSQNINLDNKKALKDSYKNSIIEDYQKLLEFQFNKKITKDEYNRLK